MTSHANISIFRLQSIPRPKYSKLEARESRLYMKHARPGKYTEQRKAKHSAKCAPNCDSNGNALSCAQMRSLPLKLLSAPDRKHLRFVALILRSFAPTYAHLRLSFAILAQWGAGASFFALSINKLFRANMSATKRNERN